MTCSRLRREAICLCLAIAGTLSTMDQAHLLPCFAAQAASCLHGDQDDRWLLACSVTRAPVSAHSGDRSGLGWSYTLASRINRRSKCPPQTLSERALDNAAEDQDFV